MTDCPRIETFAEWKGAITITDELDLEIMKNRHTSKLEQACPFSSVPF